jgi:hypothetical protein
MGPKTTGDHWLLPTMLHLQNYLWGENTHWSSGSSFFNFFASLFYKLANVQKNVSML